jgi:hypothetical protein
MFLSKKHIQINFGPSIGVQKFTWKELANFSVDRSHEASKDHFEYFERNMPDLVPIIENELNAFFLHIMSFNIALHTWAPLVLPSLDIDTNDREEILKSAAKAVLSMRSGSKSTWSSAAEPYFERLISKYWQHFSNELNGRESDALSMHSPGNQLANDIWNAYLFPTNADHNRICLEVSFKPVRLRL